MNERIFQLNGRPAGTRQLLLIACCALSVIALTASAAFADAVKPTPWLAGVTQNSVYASLEATSTANATVNYGLTAGYGSSAVTESYDATSGGPGSYVHNVRLTGLSPDTLYHYQVSHGASTSADYTFRTAPTPGSLAHFGFAADSRSRTTVHNTVAANMASHNPNMMFYGGDLCATPSYSSYTNEWFVPNQVAMNARVPFVNAPGNHEDWGTNTRAFTESPAGDDGGGNGYFSFDYGDAHILILNNEISDGFGSAQWNFAAADLAASTARFKIVAFHKPGVNYGGHGSNADMANMTTQIFEPNDVDFVLGGDSHFYQHNLKNGIHHMTIGSMGAPLYTAGWGTYTVFSETTESFGIFDITNGGNTLTLRTYRGLNNTPLETIEVPEPATMSLLGLGALALIRRRRRKA